MSGVLLSSRGTVSKIFPLPGSWLEFLKNEVVAWKGFLRRSRPQEAEICFCSFLIYERNLHESYVVERLYIRIDIICLITKVLPE